MASTQALLEQIEFLHARVEALQNELEKAKKIMKEIIEDYELN